MDTIALIMISLAFSLPVIGLAWIYRHHKRLNSLNGIFAMVIVAFTMWHYFSYAHHAGTAWHEIITSLFVLAASAMNVYCSVSTHAKLQVGINRRMFNRVTRLPCPERREKETKIPEGHPH